MAGLQILRSGSFRSLEHATKGTALVLRRAAGRLIPRLEHLRTSNGPDLRVYLPHVPASNDLYAYRILVVNSGSCGEPEFGFQAGQVACPLPV